MDRIFALLAFSLGLLLTACQTDSTPGGRFSSYYSAQEEASKAILNMNNMALCSMAVDKYKRWEKNKTFEGHVKEAQRRGLTCGVKGYSPSQTASSSSISPSSSTDLVVDIYLGTTKAPDYGQIQI